MHKNLHKKLTALLNLVKAINDDQRSGQKPSVIVRRPTSQTQTPPAPNPVVSKPAAAALKETAQPRTEESVKPQETARDDYEEAAMQNHVNSLPIDQALTSEWDSVRSRVSKRPDFKEWVHDQPIERVLNHFNDDVKEEAKSRRDYKYKTGQAVLHIDPEENPNVRQLRILLKEMADVNTKHPDTHQKEDFEKVKSVLKDHINKIMDQNDALNAKKSSADIKKQIPSKSTKAPIKSPFDIDYIKKIREMNLNDAKTDAIKRISESTLPSAHQGEIIFKINRQKDIPALMQYMTNHMLNPRKTMGTRN